MQLNDGTEVKAYRLRERMEAVIDGPQSTG